MPKSKSNPQPPALSPEAMETRIIAKTYALIEKRIDEGTATAQELVHFAKLGSQRAKLEKENLIAQNKLLTAKTDAISSERNMESIYLEAVAAMSRYTGSVPPDEDEY